MKGTVRERIRELSVDQWGDGGLTNELDRIAMIDEPTLIIGLGGTGVDALLHAKDQFRRKLKLDQNGELPGRLAFLAIDTDWSDLERKHAGDTHLKPEETCNIYEPNIDAFMKNHRLITRDYISEWLSDGMPPTLDRIYSTCCIRQYGRFMLFSNAERLAARILQMLHCIWAAGKENGAAFQAGMNKVSVYILTGISGGTGSGIFLDVAYMVRNIVERQMGLSINIDGMLFLPEVNACRISSPLVKNAIRANAYAALKELDFWMNPDRGRRFRQQYTEYMAVDTDATPFNTCYLISPQTDEIKAYYDCMKKAGKALLRLRIADEEHFSISSFLSSFKGGCVHSLGGSYAGNYSYFAIGIDENGVPADRMVNYIAHYVLEQEEHLSEYKPQQNEVQDFFKLLCLDERSMERLFNRYMHIDRDMRTMPLPTVDCVESLMEAIKRYNISEVLAGDVLEQELELWAKERGSFYSRKKSDMVNDRLEAVLNELEKLMLDPQKGIFYAHRMLCSSEIRDIDILENLQMRMDKLQAFLIEANNQRAANQKMARKAKADACKHRFMPLIGRIKFENYLEEVFNQYDHERYIRFAEVLYEVYYELKAKLTEYNNMVLKGYVRIIEDLSAVFRENAQIIAGNPDFERMQIYIDSELEERQRDGRLGDLAHEFHTMLLENGEAWLDGSGDIGASFSHFVADKFQEILDISLENYYRITTGMNSAQELGDYVSRSVLPMMKSRSAVMFNANSVIYSINNTYQRSLISYPRAATVIGHEVKDFSHCNFDLDGHALMGCSDAVPSALRGSISWLRLSGILPLYAIENIAEYQEVYDHCGLYDHHLGRHLKMGKDDNWLDLPSPIPEAVWPHMGYSNPIQAQKNDEIRRVFREAWESGVVLPNPNVNGKYEVGRVDEAEYCRLLASAPMTEEEQRLVAEQSADAAISANPDDVKRFIDVAKAFAQNGWKPSWQMLMTQWVHTLRNGELVEGAGAEERTCQMLSENLVFTPDVAEELRRQTQLKQKLMNVIEAHETFILKKENEAMKPQIYFFAQCLFFGLYKKILPKVYQLNGEPEGVESFQLMSISDYSLAPSRHPYYAMFRKFLTLSEEQHEIMRRIIERRRRVMEVEMMNGDATHFVSSLNSLKQIDDEVKMSLENSAEDPYLDQHEILEFYRQLRSEFELWLE